MARLAEKLRERAARASHALDHRIQVLRSKIKNPRQMQMIEKVTFVVAVISLLGLHQLMILAPHYIVTFYLWTMIPLMLIRYVDFHRQKWHYFMIDFCYYVNAVLFYFLIKDPSNSTLFKVVFTWSNGPLLWAIVVWRSGLVFHSLPHITTIYIHLLPAFVTYVIRWIPIDGQDVSSLCSGNACVMHVSDLFGWPIALYLVWQILYLVKTEVLDRKKLQADKDIGTSLRHLIAFYQNHFWGKVVNSLGPQFSILMFVLMQLVYTAVVSIPTALFYQNQLLHLGFILVILTISIWNGAGFYVYKVNKNTDISTAPVVDEAQSAELWYHRYIRRGKSSSVVVSRSRRPSKRVASTEDLRAETDATSQENQGLRKRK